MDKKEDQDLLEMRVHMTYFPPFMPAGIATAFASVVILAVIFIKDRKKEPVADRSDIMFGRIYLAAFAVAFTVIYVIPCIGAAGRFDFNICLYGNLYGKPSFPNGQISYF